MIHIGSKVYVRPTDPGRIKLLAGLLSSLKEGLLTGEVVDICWPSPHALDQRQRYWVRFNDHDQHYGSFYSDDLEELQ